MPVFTYSVPAKDKLDLELMELINKHCKTNCLNKSALVVALLRAWAKENDVGTKI